MKEWSLQVQTEARQIFPLSLRADRLCVIYPYEVFRTSVAYSTPKLLDRTVIVSFHRP